MAPKGSIDLTLAKEIETPDKVSIGIQTPGRTWKLQCDTESVRDKWFQELRDLTGKNSKYTGFIPQFTDSEPYTQPLAAAGPNPAESEMKTQSMMAEQDKQIMNLNNRMQSLLDKQEIKSEQLKDEIAAEYKQEIENQRQKIQVLSERVVAIEMEKVEVEEKVKELTNENKELKEMVSEQNKAIEDKEEVMTSMQADIKSMRENTQKLEEELKENEKNMYSISGKLFKIQGDNVSKLKYGKQSLKTVIFVNKINQLFYYDANGSNKGDQKYIMIKDITVNNNSIQKQMNKPWFLVIGEKRSALFASEQKETVSKWLRFINKSLGKLKDNDDQKDDK